MDEVDEFVELVRTKKDVTIIREYLNSHPQVLEDEDVSLKYNFPMDLLTLGIQVLWQAIDYKNLDVVKLLVEEFKVDVNRVGEVS